MSSFSQRSPPSTQQQFKHLSSPTTPASIYPSLSSSQPATPYFQQSPLTTGDLRGPQTPQWGGAGSIAGWNLGSGGSFGRTGEEAISHQQQVQQLGMNSRRRPEGKRYIPSHLHQKSFSPSRSATVSYHSPPATYSFAQDDSQSATGMLTPKDTRRKVSFGNVTMYGSEGSRRDSNFGGSMFGTGFGSGFGIEKDDQLVTPSSSSNFSISRRPSREELPPASSLYDLPFSQSSFPSLGPNASTSPPLSPPPDTTSALFTAVPPARPSSPPPVPTAVMVFGFPPHLSNEIIREYGRYGPILEHFSSPVAEVGRDISIGENWVRLTYRDRAAAARAVTTNGQTWGGGWMIGCVYAPGQEAPMEVEPAGLGTPKPLPTNPQSGTTGAERRVQIIRGKEGMFATPSPKKDVANRKGEKGWGEWIWETAIGSSTAAGGAQVKKDEGTLAKLARGVGEIVFGF